MLLSDEMNASNTSGDLNEMFGYWKNFRINDLKDDLAIYTKQMEGQKNIQNDLNSQLKFLQKTLASTNPQIFDKTSYNIILESFTNQLLNLSNRIKITENLVYNLVNFFSNSISVQQNEVTPEEKTNETETDENNQTENYIYEDDDESEENYDQNNHDSNNSFQSNQNGPVYDISDAQTPDMSTEEIARKVKEYLQLSKVGQRTFSEGLLNMRQANFSSLLSHPLPWQELSKTYRDRFLIMYQWLNDPDRLTKLSSLAPFKKSPISQNQSKYSFSSTVLNGKVNKQSLQKRKRVKLKTFQKEKLNDYFTKNQYPSNSEITQLSSEINLPTKKVYTWFSNQRHLTRTI